MIGTLQVAKATGASSSSGGNPNSWPMWRGDTTHSGYSTSTIPTSTPSLLWSISVGLPSNPAIANGIIYFGSYEGIMYALNAVTGASIWEESLGSNPILNTPAVANGIVYVEASWGDSQFLFALDGATGAVMWSYNLGGGSGTPYLPSPVVANGIVYAGDATGNTLFALDAATGAYLWSYSNGGEIDYSSPAVANGVVYVCPSVALPDFEYQGYLVALDATTGTPLWSLSTDSRITSSPAVAGSLVYFVSNGYLYAVDATSGNIAWQESIGGLGSGSESSPPWLTATCM